MFKKVLNLTCYVVLLTITSVFGVTVTTDAQIQAEIETLRDKFAETPDLYREVCTLLFFRHGITPTANKLYQFVRKGSMSAPAEALAKFWADLREKSRVRIEHPDLPDPVKTAAGELVATLWTLAQTAAQEGLTVFRSEAEAAVAEAKIARATAERELAAALQGCDQARKATQTAVDRGLLLERELAAERTGKAALTAQLEAAGRQQAVLESALTEARQDFAAELEKLRGALGRSEERCEAAEKRALLEIDRERTASAKLQKDLILARQHQQETEERYQTEVAKVQSDLGSARQKAGIAEGMLQEARSQCKSQVEEIQALRTTFVEGETRKSLLERDLAACREKIAVLEEQLLKLRQPTAKPQKRIKKTIA